MMMHVDDDDDLAVTISWRLYGRIPMERD